MTGEFKRGKKVEQLLISVHVILTDNVIAYIITALN